MYLLENFIQAIAFTLDSLLSIYFWIVLISALLSWVNPDPRNPIVRFLYSVTEPVLYHIRRRLPFVVAGGLRCGGGSPTSSSSSRRCSS